MGWVGNIISTYCAPLGETVIIPYLLAIRAPGKSVSKLQWGLGLSQENRNDFLNI